LLSIDAWKPDKLVELWEKQKTDTVFGLFSENGYWWDLPSEPSPFHDGAGLLKELEAIAPDGDSWTMVSKALGTDLITRSRHLFGLRYPGRRGRDEWLTVFVRTPDRLKDTGW